MPSEQSATPGRRRHTSIHITDLPAELLLLIEVFLDSDEDIWSLAFAYPSIPQLMIPILKELEVENHSCESTFLNRNTTNILAFLSEFPSYANEIKGIRYTHSVCQSIVTEKHGCDCMPSPSSTADEEVLVPWRYGWTKKEQNVLKDFAGSSGLSPDPDFMHALTNATGYDLELAKVALLLALGRNIRSLHIGIKSSTWCDLARISDMALLPVLRAQERHLDEVVITKGPAKGYSKPRSEGIFAYDRNIAQLLSIVFLLPSIKRLTLHKLTESVCHKGEWWTQNTPAQVESITMSQCVTHINFFPRLLRAVSGLCVLDLEIQDLMFTVRNPGDERDAGLLPLVHGLHYHKHTLRSLRLVYSAQNLIEQRRSPRAHRPIQSLQHLVSLKRLEIDVKLFEPDGGDDTRWENVLPASLHTLAFTHKNFATYWELLDFTRHLLRTKKSGFQDLVHIIDLGDTYFGHMQAVGNEELVHVMHAVGLKPYPDDSRLFAKWMSRLRRMPSDLVDTAPSPDLHCMGRCGHGCGVAN